MHFEKFQQPFLPLPEKILISVFMISTFFSQKVISPFTTRPFHLPNCELEHFLKSISQQSHNQGHPWRRSARFLSNLIKFPVRIAFFRRHPVMTTSFVGGHFPKNFPPTRDFIAIVACNQRNSQNVVSWTRHFYCSVSITW